MKKVIKAIVFVAIVALAVGLFAACNNVPGPNKPPNDPQPTDCPVVIAFNSVPTGGQVVNQTAAQAQNGLEYLVTVVTTESVVQYTVSSAYVVTNTTTVAEGSKQSGVSLTAATIADTDMSVLQRVYSAALEQSGIAESEVVEFDFDKDEYLGKPAYKVEIGDANAEYTFVFAVSDMSVLDRKVEFRNASSGETSYIGESRAREIAVSASGVNANNVALYSTKFMLDNGRKIYRVRFRVAVEGYRYTVDVDAVSGNVVKYSKSILDDTVKGPTIDKNITEDEAKDIALGFAFPSGTEGVVTAFDKVKLDYEDGRLVYEIELEAQRAVEPDGDQLSKTEITEYEFEILASDGTILDVEIETSYMVAVDDIPGQGSSGGETNKFLTRDEAIGKVREKVGADVLILDVELENENIGGKKVYFYEVEVKVGGREYDYIVDAVTGEVKLDGEYDGNADLITEDEAIAIALQHFSLTSDEAKVYKVKLEEDDGEYEYEVKLMVKNMEYTVEIDAKSGRVLESDISFD